MATKESINIACIEACKRIEARVKALTGLEFTPLPRNHRDNDILRKQQLETIADWLDRVPDGGRSDEALEKLNAMVRNNATKAELVDEIKEYDNGDIDDSAEDVHPQ